MRRDVTYFFRADVKAVYQAYLTAAQNKPFERSCTQEPYYCFRFGLNFSMKYNMNGGSCTLRFIPYMDGGAVNIRFTIAQGVGARCEAYAKALTEKAVAVLNLPAQPLELDVEKFLEESNWVTPDRCPPPAPPKPVFQSPVPPTPPAPVERPMTPPPMPPQPTPPIQGEPVGCCQSCGEALLPEAKFCFRCGTPIQPKCHSCGKALPPNALFCPYCGMKQ